MADPRFEHPHNVAPNRTDVLRFAPFILSALYLDGVHGKIDVSQVIAVLEYHEHDLAALAWGDLRAIAKEALVLSALDPRSWRARAMGRLIPMQFGYTHLNPVAALAVRDETLSELVMRFEVWQDSRSIAVHS